MTKTILLVALGAAACGPTTKPAPEGGQDPEEKTEPVSESDPFCDDLAVVLAGASNDFESLRGEDRTADEGSTRTWASNVTLDGRPGEVSIMSDQGNWSTSWDPDGEGLDQVRTLKARIAGCPAMAGFALDPFEPDEDNDDPDFQTVFTWRAGDGGSVELEYIPASVNLWIESAP